MNSDDTLLAIQERLDGVEWTPDTLEEIARIMVSAGYRIRDREDRDIDDQQLSAQTDGLTMRSAVERPNLLRWRGAFNPLVEIEAEGDEWC